MNYVAHHLKIHVHKTNGSIEKFVQSDAEAIRRIVNEFQPDQIFAREKVIITGGNLLTSFPTRQVTRIDLISEPSSHLIFPPGIVDAVELTEAEYRGLLQNPALEEQWNQKRARDISTVVFLNVEMAGQPSLFLALEVSLEPPDDHPEAVRPVVLERFTSTRPATITLLMALTRYFTTRPVAITRPMALRLF